MSKTINRNMMLVALAACAMMFSLLYGCRKPTGQGTPVRIGWQVAWATQGQIAQALDRTNALSLFGLNGDFHSFTYGAPLSEAALANQLDVAFVGDQPAINLISRTSDWKIVARLMDFRVALVVPPDSAIKKNIDLKGKTIGIPFGASTHRFALEVLKDSGLDPAKDVHIVNIDIQEQGDIVRAGAGRAWSKVDAFASWDHHIALYEREGLAKVLTSGTALGVVAMSESFIKANPEAAANVLAAYKLAYYYYATHQDQVNAWFSEAAQGKFDVGMLREVGAIEPNLRATESSQIMINLAPSQIATLQSAADFAFEQKLIKNQVNVTKAIDTSLVDRANGKINAELQARLAAVK
jgi:ABC-type nitrate/sulfonate/bicarbonate transport system substrate-binding protein